MDETSYEYMKHLMNKNLIISLRTYIKYFKRRFFKNSFSVKQLLPIHIETYFCELCKDTIFQNLIYLKFIC